MTVGTLHAPWIGRLRSGIIVVAAAGVLGGLAGCGPGSPQRVALSDLAFDPDAYDDAAVTTTGVVREFGEADGARVHHFVIEDDAHNRVQLLPDEAAEPYVGEEVTVTGRFSFDETTGRAIEVETISSAG
jgi:hypothetical protein